MGFSPRRLMADISNNNAGFDAAAYHRAGHRVVAIKATEGAGGVQSTHGRWADDAHRHGVHVIHYHFAHPDVHTNAAAEAREFLGEVERHWRRGDRVAVDLEVTPSAVDVNAYIQSWHDRLRENAGPVGSAHAWLYTGAAYFSEHQIRLPRGWRLWLADYTGPILSPAFFGHVFHPWAHQFTDGIHGPSPHGLTGVVGRCDVSALTVRASLGLHLR